MLLFRKNGGLYVVVCWANEWMAVPVHDIDMLGFDGNVWTET